MTLPSHDEFVERIDRFLARHSIAETTFGRDATGEPALLSTIRAGRSPTLRIMTRISDYMARVDAEAAVHRQPASEAGASALPGNGDDVTASAAA